MSCHAISNASKVLSTGCKTASVFPLLLVLAIKLYKSSSASFKSPKLVAITFVGYIVALWSNSVFHWLGLLATQGPSFLFGESSILAWNALILMSLAVIFSIVAGFYLTKNREITKWTGLALTSVGFHFLFYLIYHLFASSLNSVWLTDIWAVGLLGLGLSIIKNKTNLSSVKIKS